MPPKNRRESHQSEIKGEPRWHHTEGQILQDSIYEDPSFQSQHQRGRAQGKEDRSVWEWNLSIIGVHCTKFPNS